MAFSEYPNFTHSMYTTLHYMILHTQSSRLEKKVPPPSRRCRRRQMTSKFDDSMGNRLCLRALFPLPSPSKSLVHTYFLLVFFVATTASNNRRPSHSATLTPNLIQHAYLVRCYRALSVCSLLVSFTIQSYKFTHFKPQPDRD